MKIYISGPYSGDIETNIEVARAVMWELMRRGHTVFCPHTQFAGGQDIEGLDYEDFMRACLDLVPLFDAMFMLPYWPESSGAYREHERACVHKLKMFYSLDDVPILKPSEGKTGENNDRPEQRSKGSVSEL